MSVYQTVEEMLSAGGPDWQRVLEYVESMFRHFEMWGDEHALESLHIPWLGCLKPVTFLLFHSFLEDSGSQIVGRAPLWSYTGEKT